MNIVLEDAEEISLKRKSRKALGAHSDPFLGFSIFKINIKMILFSSYFLKFSSIFFCSPLSFVTHHQAAPCSRVTTSR